MTRYAVLSFSPEPEFSEFVNVALLVLNGRPRLVYDATFPKLHCIAPSFDAEILKVWLQQVEERLHSPAEHAIRHAIESHTSQLRVGEFHTLAAGASPQALEALIAAYLKPSRKKVLGIRHAALSVAERLPTIESLLDGFIRTELQISPPPLRRATPEQFLTPEVSRRLGSNGFRIACVASGRHKLVLIDGVNLKQGFSQVTKRAQEVRYGFFRMAEAKGLIRKLEGRDVVTASVVFNSDMADMDPRMKFTVHELRRESDLSLVAGHSDESDRTLKQTLLEAGLEPLLLEH